jgi:hypothetical protein
MLHRQLHPECLEGLAFVDILQDVENAAGHTDILLSQTEGNVLEVDCGTYTQSRFELFVCGSHTIEPVLPRLAMPHFNFKTV